MNFDTQILDTMSGDELKKLKTFLFEEQVKIQARKEELFNLGQELEDEKAAIESERKALNLKIKTESKRFDDNEKLMAQKQHIIERAYEQLAVDKKVLECERLNFEYEKRAFKKQENLRSISIVRTDNSDCVYFRGVDNQLSLRKRYKDLLKIYHPDNRCGDKGTLLQIQKEYDSLKKQYYDV